MLDTPIKTESPDSLSDRGDQFSSRKWLAAMTLSGCLVPGIYAADLPLMRWVGQRDLPGDLEKAIQLSEFFAHGFGVAIILISIAILFPGQRRKIPRMLACVIGCGVAANTFKSLFARVRPIATSSDLDSIHQTWGSFFPAWRTPETFDYATQSFPSAHTCTAFGLAIALCWLYPRGRFLYLACAGLAAVQRVVSQAHWPSDVAAGLCLSIFVTSCILAFAPVAQWFRRFENPKQV